MHLIYKGPSQLNQKPVIAVLTDKSVNKKTGPMLQVWVLDDTNPPTKADTTSICGECPIKTSCYVNIAHAPSSIYYSYKRNNPKPLSIPQIQDWGYRKRIRIGAYGDPAAVPIAIWRALTTHAISTVGYTHQSHRDDLRGLVMASVESLSQARALQEQGWKTFRILAPSETLSKNEVLCPNYTHNIQCYDCMLCTGNKMNVAIYVHGLQHKIKKFVSQKDAIFGNNFAGQ